MLPQAVFSRSMGPKMGVELVTTAAFRGDKALTKNITDLSPQPNTPQCRRQAWRGGKAVAICSRLFKSTDRKQD